MTFDRAKPALQLQRNGALRKALDFLKKASVNQGQTIEIVWLKEDTKDKNREVRVNGALAFCQTLDDMPGIFVSPFNGPV